MPPPEVGFRHLLSLEIPELSSPARTFWGRRRKCRLWYYGNQEQTYRSHSRWSRRGEGVVVVVASARSERCGRGCCGQSVKTRALLPMIPSPLDSPKCGPWPSYPPALGRFGAPSHLSIVSQTSLSSTCPAKVYRYLLLMKTLECGTRLLRVCCIVNAVPLHVVA